MLKPMLVASALLPMPGRPARMTRSDAWSPPIWPVEIGEPRREARKVAVALVGGAGHVDGGEERGVEGLEAAVELALLGDLVEPLLRLLDLLLRRHLDRRVIGDVDHVLADADERPAERKVVDAFGRSPRH